MFVPVPLGLAERRKVDNMQFGYRLGADVKQVERAQPASVLKFS
jgi:hypothetical protein